MLYYYVRFIVICKRKQNITRNHCRYLKETTLSVSFFTFFVDLHSCIHVQRQNAVKVLGANVNVCVAVVVHVHRVARAGAIYQIARDDVTVLTCRQTGLQSQGEIVQIVVERHESLVATAEGDLIVTIVPPVRQFGATHSIFECHHIVDLTPAMLTNPAIGAATIRVEFG